MNLQPDMQAFGEAVNCTSLTEIEELLKLSAGNSFVRKQTAAYGLVLAAAQAVPPSAFFEDTRRVLDALVSAKAIIDSSAWHTREVIQTTAFVLQTAQDYFDEQTIPCTEWPSPQEIVGVTLDAAKSVLRSNRRCT